MVMRVQMVQGEYRVVLPPEAMEALNLTEGSAVEIERVMPESTDTRHRYASVQETLEAFRRIEPLHRNTFRELAK